ncbi:MAG: transcriptional regulator [Cyanobacteria bacterium P01_G01_bin.38]
MPTSRSYQEYLIESLKDPDEAAAYLEAALEEGDDSLLQVALKNVIEAKIALNESNDADNSLPELQDLIEQLTEQPKLNLLSWFKVLNTLGLTLSITPSRSEHQVV